MHFIYAEDDVDDFFVLSEMLGEVNSNIKCVRAEHGRAVLDMLEQTERLPELIVMDLNMPVMDGKSCLKALRADSRFAAIPVCVYTTGVNAKEEPQCMELGANAYKVKANSILELRSFLEELSGKYAH